MVGVLELTQGRGRARLERWSLLGLELPRARTPVPAGRSFSNMGNLTR